MVAVQRELARLLNDRSVLRKEDIRRLHMCGDILRGLTMDLHEIARRKEGK